MSTRSPSGMSSPTTGSTLFGTGVLSPVRPASSISSVATTSTRPSAGTLSPASNPTMSPGTSSSAGTSCTCPSRLTLAVMINICFRAATLSAALPSWCRPINALKIVKATSTQAVDQSWMPITATTAVPRSTSCIRSSYCRRNAFHAGSLASSASLFGPYFWRRDSTSAALRPTAGSTSSCRQLSSTVIAYHARCVSGACVAVGVISVPGRRRRGRQKSSGTPSTRASRDEDRPRPGGRAPPDDGWDRSPTVATSSESASVHRRFTRRFRWRRGPIGDPPATTLTGVGPHHPARPYVDGARSRSSNGRPGHGGGRKGMRCTTCAIAAFSRRSTSRRRS